MARISASTASTAAAAPAAPQASERGRARAAGSPGGVLSTQRRFGPAAAFGMFRFFFFPQRSGRGRSGSIRSPRSTFGVRRQGPVSTQVLVAAVHLST